MNGDWKKYIAVEHHQQGIVITVLPLYLYYNLTRCAK